MNFSFKIWCADSSTTASSVGAATGTTGSSIVSYVAAAAVSVISVVSVLVAVLSSVLANAIVPADKIATKNNVNAFFMVIIFLF